MTFLLKSNSTLTLTINFISIFLQIHSLKKLLQLKHLLPFFINSSIFSFDCRQYCALLQFRLPWNNFPAKVNKYLDVNFFMIKITYQVRIWKPSKTNFEPPKHKHNFKVSLKYLNIHFIAFQCSLPWSVQTDLKLLQPRKPMAYLNLSGWGHTKAEMMLQVSDWVRTGTGMCFRKSCLFLFFFFFF